MIMRYPVAGSEPMLYNLAQSPISDGLWEYLLAQVPDTPPQEVLDQIKAQLEAKKLGDWFDKLTFPKTVSLDDGGKRLKFFVNWNLKPPTTRELPSQTRPLFAIEGIATFLRYGLRQEVKPPDKLAVFHGYSEKGYIQPTPHFYCLPEEVDPLREKALRAAQEPFINIEVIDFTKPPKEDELQTALNVLEDHHAQPSPTA